MTESLQQRYETLIDNIVETTLKGQIRSKEQVYQMLVKGIENGTGEIFERALSQRLTTTETQLKTETDELKQAKINRIQRALKTIQTEWERYQKQNQTTNTLNTAIGQILNSTETDRLTTLFRILDPNQKQPLTLDQIQQIAKTLHQQITQNPNSTPLEDIQEIITGLTAGIQSWQQLQPDLISWIYENPNKLGFTGPEQNGPWIYWSKKLNSPLPKNLFNTIAINESIIEFIAKQTDITPAQLIELAIILQCQQRGLVEWFDKLIYDSKTGAKLSISTFLTYAAIWSLLANGFQHSTTLNPRNKDRLINSCFQITLQILRTFSQQPYFPLYGGIFASFSGNYLKNTLDYLNEPLKQVAGTQEKARILTLLGYSQRAQGNYKQAISYHEQALEIARQAEDRTCEIANLNHLSRTYVSQKNYAEAINYSQRALILSRQSGDKQGEANALANFGFSEVFQAKQENQNEPEIYESAINFLQQGIQLAEKLNDRQSLALCYSSLGIAHVVLDQPQEALTHLAKGLEAAQFSGDLYLQGLNFTYIGQAYYNLMILQKAITYSCLGMYLLDQIGAGEFQQPANLLTTIKRQLGEGFSTILQQCRPEIIPYIGIDGFDYLPKLFN